jgi:hypothetical protein
VIDNINKSEHGWGQQSQIKSLQQMLRNRLIGHRLIGHFSLTCKQFIYVLKCLLKTHSAASGKRKPAKLADMVSVYISMPERGQGTTKVNVNQMCGISKDSLISHLLRANIRSAIPACAATAFLG